jgi:hypothetical protein
MCSLGRFRVCAWACIAALVFAGCSSRREPAQQSLGDIQAVVIAASADAAAFVPDQLSAVQNQVDGLQASFEKMDYAAVLSAAPAVMSAAQSLAADAAAKKAQHTRLLNGEWSVLAAALPDHFTAIQRRIDALGGQSKKRSSGRQASGIDLDAARASLSAVESLWSKAQAAFATGNLAEAVATAQSVETKVEALATTL